MSKASWAVVARGAGALILVNALVATATASALTGSDVTFRGRSSQHQPVSMVVSGSEIKRLTITWSARCPALHAPLKGITTYHVNVALSNGTWNTHGSYGATVPGGYQETFHVRDHGVVSGTNRVTGAFTGSVTIVRGAKHKHVDTCNSGKVAFTLTRVR